MAKMFIGGDSVDSATKNTVRCAIPPRATVDTVTPGQRQRRSTSDVGSEEAFKVWSMSRRKTAAMRAERRRADQETTPPKSPNVNQEQGKTPFEACWNSPPRHGLEFYGGLASKVRGPTFRCRKKGPTAWWCVSRSASAAALCHGIFL